MRWRKQPGTDRVPVTRHDADGTVIHGTAQADPEGGVSDFRDLAGKELVLPPGSSIRIPVIGNEEGS